MMQVTLDEDSLKHAIRMYLEKRIVGVAEAQLDVSFTVGRTEGKGTSANVSLEFKPAAPETPVNRGDNFELDLDK